ncbi:DUF3618 domain-containing protein [Aeromicrobium sp.]|uniref:DUF3618 domain-containing protein n=1 Tax=Aeromicrobium sp. TaxID=1871063 RepID=UPI003D6B41CA
MGKSETDVLVDEIEQIRLRLAGTVDELVDRAHPKSIARRSLQNVKSHFVDEQGSPRFETIIPVVAGTAAIVTAIVIIRRLTR